MMASTLQRRNKSGRSASRTPTGVCVAGLMIGTAKTGVSGCFRTLPLAVRADEVSAKIRPRPAPAGTALVFRDILIVAHAVAVGWVARKRASEEPSWVNCRETLLSSSLKAYQNFQKPLGGGHGKLQPIKPFFHGIRIIMGEFVTHPAQVCPFHRRRQPAKLLQPIQAVEHGQAGNFLL
jgi:hypothetical protein